MRAVGRWGSKKTARRKTGFNVNILSQAIHWLSCHLVTGARTRRLKGRNMGTGDTGTDCAGRGGLFEAKQEQEGPHTARRIRAGGEEEVEKRTEFHGACACGVGCQCSMTHCYH